MFDLIIVFASFIGCAILAGFIKILITGDVKGTFSTFVLTFILMLLHLIIFGLVDDNFDGGDVSIFWGICILFLPLILDGLIYIILKICGIFIDTKRNEPKPKMTKEEYKTFLNSQTKKYKWLYIGVGIMVVVFGSILIAALIANN